jgi:predicted nucleic acid-binding protein
MIRAPLAAWYALRTNDELVAQLAAKYDIDKIAAQRDVDALMNGRNLTA